MSEKKLSFPELSALKDEVDRLDYRARFRDALRTTVYTLITVVAFALLIATLFLPVLSVYGSAMEPSVAKDSMVICTKTGHPKYGDVLAFYYNNKILVRRVIGIPGDTITIDDNGFVIRNGEVLEEEYVTQHALGLCDREFPYEVPAGEYFVLADNRTEGIDSRVSMVGCVLEEEFIGVVKFAFWPLDQVGFVK